MRLNQCLIVSRLGSSLVSRLTSARVHHLAGGGGVRGTSYIAVENSPFSIPKNDVKPVIRQGGNCDFGNCARLLA